MSDASMLRGLRYMLALAMGAFCVIAAVATGLPWYLSAAIGGATSIASWFLSGLVDSGTS